MPEHTAQWNPQTQLWETEQADLFCEQRAPYSETWPTSGMTRNGKLLPLPTSEHHTGGSESSYLPTPRGAAQRTGYSAAVRRDSMSAPSLEQAIRNSERTTAARVSELGSVAAELADVSASGTGPVELLPTPRATRGGSNTETVDLLPTPRRSDGDGGANPLSRAERMDDVETRILRLLPTPKASDGEFATPRTSGRPVEKSTHLQTIATLTLEWGKYEPAIRRWEQLTRSSPAPTEPNTKGNPRLSAAFSEWMMGWPVGFVTAVPGIGRNEALRIIGNGVVPQQAVAAITSLLGVRIG